MQIRVAGIEKESIVDGPGIRYVVFAQGCSHNCPGCHNPETHSFDGGSMVEIDKIIQEVKSNPLLDGITLSGGEPLDQADGFAELAQKAGELGLNVMIYSGYTYEKIMRGTNPKWDRLLGLADILVDGPFIRNEQDMTLKFRGSKNQRIIDLKKTRLAGTIVLADI
ncbi:MAG: anaerobic ribonucleoside-triphosphate reductase activating protein [Bacillota bacterium]|jgi:anaerobic ribonucleoside-triphosphate reductase activating protein